MTNTTGQFDRFRPTKKFDKKRISDKVGKVTIRQCFSTG